MVTLHQTGRQVAKHPKKGDLLEHIGPEHIPKPRLRADLAVVSKKRVRWARWLGATREPAPASNPTSKDARPMTTKGSRHHPASSNQATWGTIYMKLSVDSLPQNDSLVLFCQTLAEYLGRRVSFA